MIVGSDGCSKLLIQCLIKTGSPDLIRKKIEAVRIEITDDEYLRSIPSVKKSTIAFHAKDDCPEVREKVFKAIKQMDFKAEFVVARKRLHQKTYEKSKRLL